MLQHHATDNRCHPIEPKPDPGSEPDTWPKGRVCPNDGTHISIYNPNDFCWQCVHNLDRHIENQADHIRRHARNRKAAEARALFVADRHREGWTNTEIADALGIQQARVSQILSANR